ncbi:MAG: hypothetical protein R2864_06345 [Syntrophotaleaceae bacterium]
MFGLFQDKMAIEMSRIVAIVNEGEIAVAKATAGRTNCTGVNSVSAAGDAPMPQHLVFSTAAAGHGSLPIQFSFPVDYSIQKSQNLLKAFTTESTAREYH